MARKRKGIAQSNLEFQKQEFPAKIKAVKRKTAKVLDRFSGASPKERGRALDARQAAERVEKRLGSKTPASGKKALSRAPAIKPGKPKSGDLLAGVKALITVGKTVSKFPERERKALKKIKRKTEQ